MMKIRHSILITMWGLFTLVAVLHILSMHVDVPFYINDLKVFHLTISVQAVAVLIYGAYIVKPFRWLDFIYIPYAITIIFMPHVFSDAMSNQWLKTLILGMSYAIGASLGSCNISTLSIKSSCGSCKAGYWINRMYGQKRKNDKIEKRKCPSCKDGYLEPI